jgi:hypothetical protein
MNIWTRLGISVAILAAFCILASETFKRHPELHARKKAIAGALAGAGTLLWLVGKVHGNGGEEFKSRDRVITTRFCGSMLAACAGIVTNITPIQQAMQAPASLLHPMSRADAREPAATPTTKSSKPSRSLFRRESSSAAAPLKVQGIIFQQKNPSAIINGKTVFVGDRVGEARVITIERGAVTVEIARQTCILALK